MHIAEQIRSHRKACGLTQEDVAAHLGVTASAVNKWERAGSMPDITLLPALARLLKIDMNTLFSFHEELTELEIANFVNALHAHAMADELHQAFEEATAKIRDYPHCEPLIYMCAVMLNAQLTLSTLAADEKTRYTQQIMQWFARIRESSDANYRAAACYWLAMQETQRGNYDQAEALIAEIPDAGYDKPTLAIQLLAARGKYDDAALQSESQILAKIVQLHVHLMQLIEYEVKTNHTAQAQAVADVATKLYELFGLWHYDATAAQLVLALHLKDKDAALSHIRTILDELEAPTHKDGLPFFYRLGEAKLWPSVESSFRATFLRELKTQPEYDFLRNEPAFQTLLTFAEDSAQ